jgi:ribosome-binding factor A
MEGLKSAAPYLQSELNKRVRLRRMPKLRFVYDTSLDRGFRVEAALREAAHSDRALEPHRESGDAPEAPAPEGNQEHDDEARD